MAAPYFLELRSSILAAWDHGLKTEQIAGCVTLRLDLHRYDVGQVCRQESW